MSAQPDRAAQAKIDVSVDNFISSLPLANATTGELRCISLLSGKPFHADP